MERKYEGCFLLRGDLSDDEVEKEADFIERSILNEGGNIVKKELWGRKTLAYPIKKMEEAVYYLFYFTAPPDAIARIEDHFRRKENILRYLILQRKKLPEGEEVNAGTKSQ
ncbi:MAG TPA: 30S ribosomal protein S6 [Firmicutes bacterium]|nr:30S ribosomal protein S6 [Bacillota bacterium]